MVGLGTSGYWAARWLAGKGVDVTVSDIRKASQLHPEFLEDLKALGVRLETGGHQKRTFLETDVIVVSPGVPMDTPIMAAAIKRQIPVMGEMELAARHVNAPMIAVTGTNGKTTATAFLGQMLEDAGKRVFVGGNIGTPLTAYLAQEKEADYLVLEISSFQLDTADSFTPLISVILNISPDHLDRYIHYQAYIDSKLRIFRNQGPGQTVILNNDDPVLKKAVPPPGTRVLRYGLGKGEETDAFILTGKTLLAGKSRFDLGSFSLPGRHNLENLLAVVLAGQVLDLAHDPIQKTIDTFKGLQNRLEHVSTNRFLPHQKDVRFYNDSKATNVDAAVRAVQSFDKPLVLIAGGRHKGSDYQPLVHASRDNVKGAVFMGEAANLLAEAFEGEIPYSLAITMQEAVRKAFLMAETGDVVLLAPACSSFDMFENYDHRGRVFKAAVMEVLDGR